MDLFKVYPLWDIDIVRAEGSYVWDDKGTRYLDMYGGHAVISIGHTHPHYVEKVIDQLKHIGFYSNSISSASWPRSWANCPASGITSFSCAIREPRPTKMR